MVKSDAVDFLYRPFAPLNALIHNHVQRDVIMPMAVVNVLQPFMINSLSYYRGAYRAYEVPSTFGNPRTYESDSEYPLEQQTRSEDEKESPQYSPKRA